MVIWLVGRSSKTAHRDPYCRWIERRPLHCAAPIAYEVEPVHEVEGMVRWAYKDKRGLTVRRWARLCTACGEPLGVQMSVDVTVVPEKTLYARPT